MKGSDIRQVIFMVLVILILYPETILNATSGVNAKNHFRILLIIGDQWEDPSSYLVDNPKPADEYSGYDAKPAVPGDSDFHDLAVLLKSWGIPFDIIRLDQQYLDRYMFLDINDNPKYGAVIWDVNQSDKILRQDYSIVSEMVKGKGIGMIAISDRIIQPEIQELLGLKYLGSWENSSLMKITKQHFITESVRTSFPIDSLITGHVRRPQVEIIPGTEPLMYQGEYPQLTIREYVSGSHLVWIGSDHNLLFTSQSMRMIIRKAITWTVGYCIFRTWENDKILIMDDPGGAANNYLEHWHYPELNEEVIRKYLIAPLEKHHAILNVNFVPGYVSDKHGRMEPGWREEFMDFFGTRQDYISSKRGWDEGVRKGVFTVMCHGLTHMQPDLNSEPGWYGAAYDREKSEVGWYREFGDTRRNAEIPAAEQLWRMKTASEWLKEQFGVVPLEFCPGGLGSSVSYHCNTAKLAGKAGYGWYGWEGGYLGKDMVIYGWKFFGSPDSPLMVSAPPDGHDFGIFRNPDDFSKVFEQYPAGHFISMNEFIGYIHSSNSGEWIGAKKQLNLSFEYDPGYCQFFNSNPSAWKLELSDWFIKEHGNISSVNSDQKNTCITNGLIKLPAGTGIHMIEVKFNIL